MCLETGSLASAVFYIPCVCPLCLKTKDYMPEVTHFSDMTRLETPPSLNKNSPECCTLVELSNSCKKYRVMKTSALQTRPEGLTGNRKEVENRKTSYAKEAGKQGAVPDSSSGVLFGLWQVPYLSCLSEYLKTLRKEI